MALTDYENEFVRYAGRGAHARVSYMLDNNGGKLGDEAKATGFLVAAENGKTKTVDAMLERGIEKGKPLVDDRPLLEHASDVANNSLEKGNDETRKLLNDKLEAERVEQNKKDAEKTVEQNKRAADEAVQRKREAENNNDATTTETEADHERQRQEVAAKPKDEPEPETEKLKEGVRAAGNDYQGTSDHLMSLENWEKLMDERETKAQEQGSIGGGSEPAKQETQAAAEQEAPPPAKPAPEPEREPEKERER